ncbi:hypothetical protein [uncultured Xanthomonas sp.]|uniref:hypothetical protein n=1 Tax=uncultured Xanthomonas sp. TaxID=152831 RepID=UPI0026010EE8|nr:hypothetical protein [uncultured Xanthomonas sp.]
MDAFGSKKVPGKLPESGHILWCYFEYETTSGARIRHAQRHPVLVLASAIDSSGNNFLIVAGGTSVADAKGHKRVINPWDFVISKKVAGLGYKKHGVTDQLVSDTKFSLLEKDVVALPYTERWFYTPPGCISPRIGKVLFEHGETHDAFKRASTEARLSETLNALQRGFSENKTKPSDPDEQVTEVAG